MFRFGRFVTKPIFMFAFILPLALIVEAVILEGVVGISLPRDRGSAVSSYEIRETGTEEHYITRNTQFTIVKRRQPLVLRESFFLDWDHGREGPPDATVTVEAIQGKHVAWSFQEPGERGETVTNDLYMVTKFGNGESGNLYTYFSLADGRKVRSNRFVPLSTPELEALDLSIND